jgi:hypothetical protein
MAEPHVPLGLVAGVAGVRFNRSLLGTLRLMDRVRERPWSGAVSPARVGRLTALASVRSPGPTTSRGLSRPSGWTKVKSR